MNRKNVLTLIGVFCTWLRFTLRASLLPPTQSTGITQGDDSIAPHEPPPPDDQNTTATREPKRRGMSLFHADADSNKGRSSVSQASFNT
jgi:hypothetical protein